MRRLAVVVLVAVGCGGSGPLSGAEFGEQLFSEPRLSDSSINVASCATCHSVRAEGDPDRILPGHTLFDSAFRESYWAGQELRLLDAINVCYGTFMRGHPPLAADDARAKALYEYLVTISPGAPSPALPFTVVRNVTGDVPRGDRARGERVYEAACRSCHGALHNGAGRPSTLAPVLPEETENYPELFPGVPPAWVVIEKVRHGGFFGIGGTMPPYGLEALSDEDLGALLEHLKL